MATSEDLPKPEHYQTDSAGQRLPLQRSAPCGLLMVFRRRRTRGALSLSNPYVDTQDVEEPRSRQRAILVGVGVIGVVLALTWVVLYLTAGASSSP
jgi:hypothetical protein